MDGRRVENRSGANCAHVRTIGFWIEQWADEGSRFSLGQPLFSYDSGSAPILADSGAAVLAVWTRRRPLRQTSGVVIGEKSDGLKHLFAGWAPMRPPGGAAVAAGRPAMPAEI